MVQGHANFMEYTPIFLILLTLGESQELGIIVPLTALVFVLGRSLHAATFFFRGHFMFRFFGTIFTMVGISFLGLANTLSGLSQALRY